MNVPIRMALVSMSVVGALGVGAGIVARAQTPGKTIHACRLLATGALRVTASAGQCVPAAETALTWNVMGPAGPPGPAGLPGPTGPAGPAGGPDVYVAAQVIERTIFNEPQDIVSLSLPAGRFVLHGKAQLSYVDLPPTEPARGYCRFVNGDSSSVRLADDWYSATTVPLLDVVMLSAPGTITLSCDAQGASLEVSGARIVAVGATTVN